MPISKSRYNRLLDECEKHGLEVNRDRLPLPGKSYIGRELEFETEFLDELIGDNSDHGFYLGSTHDNANPEEDLYLNILGDMLKVCGFSREQVEGGNSVDDAGNSTVRLKIDGQEFGWRANITEEYIDTDVIDSMVETLNRYTDKQLYVSNYGDELYCVLACPGKVAQLISEIYVDDEDLEEEAVDSVDAEQQKEISLDDFYGERRGSELSDEGIAAGEAAIASIDSNDLAAFEASLEPIGHFVCACEIVDQIFDHLVLPEGLDKPGGPPDRPHTESFFKSLVEQFAFHFLQDDEMPRILPNMVYGASKNPQGNRFLEIILQARGVETIRFKLEKAIWAAAEYGNVEWLERFLEIEGNKSKHNYFEHVVYNATHSAVHYGQREALIFLLPYWSPKLLEKRSGSILSEAAGCVDLETIRMLVDNGFKFNTGDRFLFENAMGSCKPELLEYLFEQGMQLPEEDSKLAGALQRLAASKAIEGRIDANEIVDMLTRQAPDLWQRIDDLWPIVEMGVGRANIAWEAQYADDQDEREWAVKHLDFVHGLVDRYVSDCQQSGDENREGMQRLLGIACGNTVPCAVEQLLRYDLDLHAPGKRGKSSLETADERARILLLGSLSGPGYAADINKIGALRILIMFDADLSAFPQEWVERARNFDRAM